MRKIKIKLSFFLFFISVLVFSKGSSLAEKQKAIELSYRAINKIHDWSKIDTVDLGGEVQPGYAIFYTSNDQLLKVISQKYSKTSKVKSEYYMLGGNLSFVYSLRYVYNKPLDYNSSDKKNETDTEVYDPKKSKIVEERDYFENGKLIKQITNLAKNGNSTEIFLNKESDRIQQELKLLVELKEKTIK